jgi:hypothetical protein
MRRGLDRQSEAALVAGSRQSCLRPASLGQATSPDPPLSGHRPTAGIKTLAGAVTLVVHAISATRRVYERLDGVPAVPGWYGLHGKSVLDWDG